MKNSENVVPTLIIAALIGVVGTVLISMFARAWFGGELPSGGTAITLMVLATALAYFILVALQSRSR